jgi:hypothetical protein
MTPELISVAVATCREVPSRDPSDLALVALADLVETHLATIECVEARVRPGGVLDRADLDAREAARDALSKAVRR